MTATVACIDVGQGDCSVAVDDATGVGILIDCNTGKAAAAVAELDRLGCTELHAAIVSHSHQDHFGGVMDVLELLADRFCGDLYVNHDSVMSMPAAPGDHTAAGRRLRALYNRAREYQGRLKRVDADAAPGTTGSIAWEIVAPTYDEIMTAVATGDPNLASGIVLIRSGGQLVVIGGDSQLATWQRVADQIPTGAVVRWPHHGGAVGTDAAADQQLIDLLSPSTVIVSVGANNTHGHPTETFFAAASTKPLRLLCTQATGSCVAGGGAGGVCAGTVRISLDPNKGVKVVPDTPDHAAVVAAYGHGRCCVQ